MNQSVAMLPQIWKSECDQCAWVSNHTYAGFFSRSIKLRGLLEYVNAGLWEYALIVKV